MGTEIIKYTPPTPDILNGGFPLKNDLLYRAVAAEVGQKKANEEAERVDREANYDELTGLLNLRGLNRELAKSPQPVAVLYVDGTNQKAINDIMTHQRGDDAIIGTANVITSSLRPDDIAARIGGDEFLVILNREPRDPAHDEDLRSPDEVLGAVMGRVKSNTDSFLVENPDLVEKAGFDIAVGGVIWDEGLSIVELKNSAEAAMYAAKQKQHAANGSHRIV